MKTISWKRLALAAAFAGSLTITGSVLAASQPDAWVTSKVKLSLFTTENVGSTDINVDTMDGRVTLHGTVASEAEKAKAEQVTKSVDGVREVRNMLAVVPPAKQDAVAAKDAEIEDRVEQALANDKSLSDSDIDVASVNAGIVVLEGSAASLSDHVRAVETARDVKGVRQVKSEVKSPDTLSDAELRRDEGAKASDQVATTSTDMWITTASKVRLIANANTPANEINVDTRNGEVTLFGMVPSDSAKRDAEAEVRKVSGVKTVRNALQVVPAKAQNAVKASDSDIKTRVAEQVDDNKIAESNIDVEVKDGVVRLTGTVENQTDRLRALTVARSTNGVRSVVDQIRIQAN